MKKTWWYICIILAVTLISTGCAKHTRPFLPETTVTVISREDGSGTRSAFVDLVGITAESPQGKLDKTSREAVVVNGTAIVMTMVSTNPYAIGYISLGSLNDTVQAVQINGIEPSVEAIQNGSYGVARSFYIATMDEHNPITRDFLSFIMSSQGQAVVAEHGYVPLETENLYQSLALQGRIVVAGSSSVAPVMEKLKEAYIALNPEIEVDIQQSDSSTGLSAVTNRICDIAMSSRALSAGELERGLIAEIIAYDGIVVIVHPENPYNRFTTQQIAAIFKGEAATWEQVWQEQAAERTDA